MPQDVSIAAGQAGRPLPAFTVQMHQDLAFDSAEAFRQAVARDVEQCIATAHLRSIAALPEEDGEPAVGSGGEPQTECSHAHKGHGAPVSLGLRPEVHQSDVPGGAAQWATLWHATTSHDQDVECLACMGRKWPACGHRAAASEPMCLTAALCVQAPSGRPCALHRPSGQLPAGRRGRLYREQPEVRRLCLPPVMGFVQSRRTAHRQPSVRDTGSRWRCRPVLAACTALCCILVMHKHAIPAQPKSSPASCTAA